MITQKFKKKILKNMVFAFCKKISNLVRSEQNWISIKYSKIYFIRFNERVEREPQSIFM